MKKMMIAALLMGTLAAQAQSALKKEADGTCIVNTTTLAGDVDGYNAATPVEIYIKKNKILKVEMLKNQETPKYNARVKKSLLVRYEGMKLTKGKALPEVDGVTGATFTSNAVKENVRRGVDYYWKHK